MTILFDRKAGGQVLSCAWLRVLLQVLLRVAVAGLTVDATTTVKKVRDITSADEPGDAKGEGEDGHGARGDGRVDS